MLISTSSWFIGGAGASNRYSVEDAAVGGFSGAATGFSNSQVLPASSTTADTHASREAYRGNALQRLAGRASSLSRMRIAPITPAANHGPACSAREATPLKISRVARISCAASWQVSQAAMWLRCAAGHPSLNCSTRTASGRAAAESSSKFCDFQHSSRFFSRFHIPASSLLLPSFSISALLCLAYHPAPGSKKSNLHRIAVQIQNFRNLLDRKPFHFFQDQHQPVPFIQSFQQPLHALPRCDALTDIRPGVLFFPCRHDHPGLFLAQIGFVHQGSNLFFPQQVPALIHRDLIKPGAECRSLIKSLQREIRFNKNLLGDIFHVLAPSQDTARHCKYAVLMTPHQFLKRLLVLSLRPANQFAVGRRASKLGGARRYVPHRGGQVERLHFWDARHRFLVTAIISGLPEPASFVSLRRPENFACFASYSYGIIPS